MPGLAIAGRLRVNVRLLANEPSIMLAGLWLSTVGMFALLVRLIVSLPAAGWRAVPRRMLILLPGWCAFVALNLLHWVGFFLDELLFRGYRRLKVARPVFILGIPRSGTTHLQRVLAADEGFTTLTLWEAILAPSITERYFWSGVGRLFGTLGIGGAAAKNRLTSRMDAIHELGLLEPEEDFLLLLWVEACFLTVVACPASEHYWRLVRFDQAVPENRRRSIMNFYRRCLRKHLYFHGNREGAEGVRLLSKNPTFTSMMSSLEETFPDASFVGCTRTPKETVPSQLSSLQPALELLGDNASRPAFRDRMVQVLKAYYDCLDAPPVAVLAVPMMRLRSDLVSTVSEIMDTIAQEPTAAFSERLAALAAEGRQYQSGHHYRAADFDLDEADLKATFRSAWQDPSQDQASS